MGSLPLPQPLIVPAFSPRCKPLGYASKRIPMIFGIFAQVSLFPCRSALPYNCGRSRYGDADT